MSASRTPPGNHHRDSPSQWSIKLYEISSILYSLLQLLFLYPCSYSCPSLLFLSLCIYLFPDGISYITQSFPGVNKINTTTVLKVINSKETRQWRLQENRMQVPSVSSIWFLLSCPLFRLSFWFAHCVTIMIQENETKLYFLHELSYAHEEHKLRPTDTL